MTFAQTGIQCIATLITQKLFLVRRQKIGAPVAYTLSMTCEQFFPAEINFSLTTRRVCRTTNSF